eukprot:2504792-Prymnesium_polylepis.1
MHEHARYTRHVTLAAVRGGRGGVTSRHGSGRVTRDPSPRRRYEAAGTRDPMRSHARSQLAAGGYDG